MAKIFLFIKELDAFCWTWNLIYVNILQTLAYLIISKNTKKVDDNTFWIEFCGSQANEKWSKHAFLQDEVSNSQYWYSIPLKCELSPWSLIPQKPKNQSHPWGS